MKCKIIAIPGRVQKLGILASREIVYSILNLSHIFEYRSWHWCMCTRFQGCPLENGEENYCNICKFKFDFCINEMSEIRNSKNIIDTYLSRKKDLAEIIKFDPTVDNFWDHDFKFKWRDYEGNEHECLVKNTDFLY